MSDIEAILLEPIDPDTDDVGEDPEWEHESGARASIRTPLSLARGGASKSETATAQAGARLGNVAAVANLVQTGNVLNSASTGVSAALAPIVAITGPIGIALALLESMYSGYSAVRTHGQISRLGEILKRAKYAISNPAKDGTVDAIAFSIKKLNKKRKRKRLGCAPVLGACCNTAYTVARSIKKRSAGTRGTERRAMASTLWTNARLGDSYAVDACIVLLGSKIYNKIKAYEDGHLVLKKRLKSY